MSNSTCFGFSTIRKSIVSTDCLCIVFNYKKLVYLAQAPSAEGELLGQRAADRLGLAFEYRITGYGELASSLSQVNEKVIQWQN